MKKISMSVVLSLLALPALADVAPQQGAFLQFRCQDQSTANPVVAAFVFEGAAFYQEDLKRAGYGLTVDGNVVLISQSSQPSQSKIGIAVRAENGLPCDRDDEMTNDVSDLSKIALNKGLAAKKSAKILSECRALNYNSAGVANWGKDEAVTVTLSPVDGLEGGVTLSKVVTSSFKSLNDCEKAVR